MNARKPNWKRIITATGVIGAIAATWLSPPIRMSAQDKTSKIVEVSASDIPSRVRIIGELGKPLFTVVKVEGTWKRPPSTAKSREMEFQITKVSDAVLEVPIVFEIDRVHFAPSDKPEKLAPVADEKWSIPAFETGGMVGFPDELWEVLDVPPASFPHGHRFLTELHIISHSRNQPGQP